MKILREVLAVSAAVTVVATFAPPAQAGSQLQALTASKSASIQALTRPLSCITKRDPKDAGSPIFHGCVDWHSAVHAHYALYAASAMTGNSSYAQQAASNIGNSMSREASYMRGKPTATRSDNPYGFAWFLKFAQEAELAGRTDVRPLADYAAEQVAAKLASLEPRDSEYNNASWNALRLHEWAVYTNNAELKSTAAGVINSKIKDWSCSLSNDASSTGFFAPCSMRLAAIAVANGSAAKSFVDQQAQGFQADYLANAINPHQAGRNFSQAYALAVAARAVGNESLAEQSASLINNQLRDSSVWSTSYDRSHWIPQYGVLAIQALTAPASNSGSTNTTTASTSPSSSTQTGNQTSGNQTRPSSQPSLSQEGSSPAADEADLAGEELPPLHTVHAEPPVTTAKPVEAAKTPTSGQPASGEPMDDEEQTVGITSGSDDLLPDPGESTGMPTEPATKEPIASNVKQSASGGGTSTQVNTSSKQLAPIIRAGARPLGDTGIGVSR